MIGDARELEEAGDLAGALALLEEAGDAFRDDPIILEYKADLYRRSNDFLMAGMAFERLAGLGENHHQAYLDAAAALAQAGEYDLAIRSLDAYLATRPGDADAQILRGRYLSRMNRHEAAAASYLEAVRIKRGEVDGLLAVEVGNAFLALEQPGQAERYYQEAYDKGGVAKVDAMLGLLETSYRRKRWPEAYSWMEKIDQEEPSLIDSSRLAPVRRELKNWRAESVAASDVFIELDPRTEIETGSEEGRSEDEGQSSDTEVVIAGLDALGEPVQNEETARGKLAPADRSSEPSLSGRTDRESGGQFVGPGSDPAGTVSAAGTGLTRDSEIFATETDEASLGGGQKLAAVENDPVSEPMAETVTEEEVITDREPTPLDLARNLALGGKHDRAVTEYLKILAKDLEQAEVWHLLAVSYRAMGKWSDAEAASLEAVRRDPTDIVWTFGYLKAVERARSPERLVMELEKAYQRIPNSPDLVLALARAYIDIEGNARNAAVYYRLFLEMAPSHPEAFSAEQELAVLRIR